MLMTQFFISNNRSIQSWKRCISLAQCCSNMRQLKVIHAIFITQGIHQNNYAISKLIDFCALRGSGSLPYASLIFNQIELPNLYIYNTLIRGYSHSSQPQSALHYFDLLMKMSNDVPDHHTFHFVLLASINACWVLPGKKIHSWVVKNGLAMADSYIQTALIRLYIECKVLVDARKLFDEIPQRDLVKWNVLMKGHVQHSLPSDALSIFQHMLTTGVEPDEFCLTTGLKACAQMGALWQGRWIHEYAKNKKDIKMDVFFSTALVDMYCKCGCVDKAAEVFEEMPKRNLFSWAAMISGFALHGYAKEAMNCLNRMEVEDHLKPDGIVFLGVLMACSHAGLLEEGRLLLEQMETRYGVSPKHEHYSCMVDLVCRRGQLEEALELIRRMPMKPCASVWGALLSGCRNCNNVDLAEVAVKELLLLEYEEGANEDGVYVQLSEIYLVAKRREDGLRIRKMIGDKGMKKTAGYSKIEVDEKAYEFVSGDVFHLDSAKICAMLQLISLHIASDLAYNRMFQPLDT